MEVITMTPHEHALMIDEFMAEQQKLPKAEREANANARLMEGGIIDENGEFTDHYAYSREYYRRKKAAKVSA
jgi:hypothetical protein